MVTTASSIILDCRSLRFRVWGVPVAQKTYLFKELYIVLYIESVKRNPKKVGLFGFRCGLSFSGFRVLRV